MLNTLFSPWPSFTEEEAEKIKEVLLSNKVNYWTGQECQRFEKEYAHWVGVKYAITVANGTLALELALKAIDLSTEDEVIVPARTFVASASAVIACGAKPIFSDVELDSQNISAAQIEKVLTPKTKAVIVVHLGGVPAEMDAIMALSEKCGFYVIEDCAQAHGAKYKSRSVGSIGHIGIFSFCQDKIMTTGGEGGMVTTKDKSLFTKMWSYKDHGKDYFDVFNKQHPPGFRWLHSHVGSNFRMTEIQAAIGRIQLRKISQWLTARRANSLALDNVANKFQLVRSINLGSDFQTAYYKQYLFINEEYLAKGWTRDAIIQAVNDHGVPCYSGACSEIYLETVFQYLALQPIKRLPNAKKLGETSLMFLVHPTLTEIEIQKTCGVLFKVLNQAQSIRTLIKRVECFQ